MKDFKRNIYKTPIENETIILDPFDYMIVTYSYRFDDFTRDLDSSTRFGSTGTIEDTKFVGYNQGQYVTPTDVTPINSAYLFQNGDDSGNGLGESIVINFKNLELASISENNDIQVELYAGWCNRVQQVYPDVANVSVTTYSGGTISVSPTLNTITSDGIIRDQFVHNNFPVIEGCGNATKTHVGTIYYNLITKVSSVVFY
jgi:hypothetical protein